MDLLIQVLDNWLDAVIFTDIRFFIFSFKICFFLYLTTSANALSKSFTNCSWRTLNSVSCKAFSLVRSMFLFFMWLTLFFTFLVLRQFSDSIFLVSSNESFSLSFCNAFNSWNQVFIFSPFSNLFLFLLVKSRSRESFFSKEHMTFERSVIFKFNFFLVFLLLVKDL